MKRLLFVFIFFLGLFGQVTNDQYDVIRLGNKQADGKIIFINSQGEQIEFYINSDQELVLGSSFKDLTVNDILSLFDSVYVADSVNIEGSFTFSDSPIFGTISVDSIKTTIGLDSASVNYADVYQFAPRWDDLRFPASALNPTGAVNDADIDTESGVALFADNATEQVVGIAQMPHGWVAGTALSPHVHWAPSDSSGGDVAWEFGYKFAYIDSVFPASYTLDTLIAASDSIQDRHQIDGFTDFTPSSGGVSGILLWTIKRIGGLAADTYSGDAKLYEFDIHYQTNAMGSREEYVK